MEERYAQLLGALEAAPGGLSGPELAERLQVSTRSIRQWVRELNHKAGSDMIHATHRGYGLDRPTYETWRTRRPVRVPKYDSPQQRLYFVVRHLIRNSSTGADVFELGEMLSVSSSTIEADLGKARELFREFHLQVRRDRDLLYLEGSERDQRRLVRQVLLQAGQGMTPTVMQGFAEEFSDYNVRALSQGIQRQLVGTDLEIDEYALNDIVIHLTIAADRVRQGHALAGADIRVAEPGADIDPATQGIIAVVADEYGVARPASEAGLLTVMLRSRARRRRPLPPEMAIDQKSLQLVRDAMRVLSAAYLLEFYDEGTLVDLAFHVQNLIDRARQGVALQNPLGDSFKNMHPFIHELTLFFVEELEKQAGISIGPGEVDFLSFHLGIHLQRQLEQGSPVTITVVVPRYANNDQEVVQALSGALGEEAVITQVISTLDYDWDRIATDLIVSAVDLTGLATVPVVSISPLLRREDIELVTDAVRAERRRTARQQVRSSILTMIEPRLFHRVAGVASKEEALTIMCATMQAEGITHGSFYEDVLDRERRSSTAFGGQFAIPHSMKMDALRPGISVMVMDRGIAWGGSNVRLVVLVALSPDSGRLFRNVLDGFIRVLAEPDNIATLLGAGDSHATFVRTLAALLD
ncbi:MAG TPA: PTS sugar transporter subunit IIA [Propionicimonas sp.]